MADFNPVSINLLKFVPAPALGTNFEFNPIVALSDDQYLGRIDHSVSSRDDIWFYGLWERHHDRQDLPFFGATLPGFAQVDEEHWQQYSGDWNHSFNGALNEARVGYTRLNYQGVEPANPTAPSSVGFIGINPQSASGEGIPEVTVTGLFNLGFSTNGPQPRVDQTYEYN